MLNNFFNFNFLFTKLSGIDPCEKHNNISGGHAWRNFFMACSKLEAMAISLVKQACGNDKLACVYILKYHFKRIKPCVWTTKLNSFTTWIFEEHLYGNVTTDITLLNSKVALN